MELDIEDFQALRSYLAERGHVLPGDAISLERLAGGVSNRTIKVGWADGHGWVLKQALKKLRVPVDWFSDPARIEVESRALRWLNDAAPEGATPRFVFDDPPNHLMAMEAIPADHQNWKALLLAGVILPHHFEQFGRLLGAIHLKSSQPDAQEVCRAFSDTTYFESLRLEPYYLYTASQVPRAGNFLLGLVAETRSRKDCLVHGDYSPKNVLIYRDKLILLDYEVFHFGEPAFDVGFAMAHFLSKLHHSPKDRMRLAEQAIRFVQVYRTQVASLPWAASLEPRLVRHALGCSLARVAGKSQLEYLDPQEIARQRDVVVNLIADPPTSIEALISQFQQKIETYAKN